MISVFLRDFNTDDEYEIPYLNIRIQDELNVGKACQVSCDFDAIKQIADYYNTTVEFILSGGLRELKVVKDTTNIYLGVVSDFDISKNQGGSMTMNIASVGLSTLLKKRRTGAKRVFTATDAGDIAWTLIDESQQSDLPYSDLGITQGLVSPSVDRDRTFRFANIQEEIIKLSNNQLKNGIDFDIDNNGLFNVFYPQKGTNREDIFFDDSNIITWGIRKPLVLSLTNHVYVLGSGFNDDVLYADRNSPNTYKQNFRLLEDILNARDIITIDTLNDKGDKLLSERQSPILGINIVHNDGQPDILDYDVGDSFRLTINELSISNQYKRIYMRSYNIDSNGSTQVTLEVQ